jgi:hypothetical protein
MVFVFCLSVNSLQALEGKNHTARYLEGARLHCPTDLHRKILVQAFHDIINLPSDTLRTIKYDNDKPEEKKLSLLDVFNKYITPNTADKKIGPGFYDEVKTDEVRYKIKDVLFALNKNKPQNNNSSAATIHGNNEWIIRIKSLFDIIIPQSAINLTCFEETLFTRSIFVRFNLPAENEIKLFLTSNSKFLSSPVALNNPLKNMSVDVRIKNKWHPDQLSKFSGGTNAIWKRNEKLIYYYVFGKDNSDDQDTVYLVCVSE